MVILNITGVLLDFTVVMDDFPMGKLISTAVKLNITMVILNITDVLLDFIMVMDDFSMGKLISTARHTLQTGIREDTLEMDNRAIC